MAHFVRFISTATILAMLSMPGQASAQHVSFFPVRPAGATLYTDTGVLLEIGVGNASGSLDLKHADGTVVSYFVGYPFTIDGVSVTCLNYRFASPAPSSALAASPSPWGMCSSWPTYIQIGHTSVTVTYWQATRGSTNVWVTDSFSTGRSPSAARRKTKL